MSATAPKDAGEAYRLHGANGFRDHLRNNQRPFEPQTVAATPNKRALPPIVEVMDFLAIPLPTPPPLVHRLLHKGSKLILSGGSKTRKTWALTHLGLCVATGTPWWGFPTTQGKVLYANFEIPTPFFQERIDTIKEKLVLDGTVLKGQFHVWNLRGYAADISDLADEIVTRVKGKYDLVILDPIYKVLGDRDENSNGDVADMMNELDRIVEATGAAVAFAHHFSKGNQAKKDAMDRMSGAGAFARDADSLLVMTKHESPDTYVVESILRNHKPVEPFCVTVDHPIMERWDAADPTKIKKINGSEKKYHLDGLLKVLGTQQLIREEIKRQYMKEAGASEGTFNKLFREAQLKPDIEVAEDGKKWKIVTVINTEENKHEPAQADEKGAEVQQ